MPSVEELLSLQNQVIGSVSRALSNFKKLGHAKMTRAVTRQRLSNLKETFDKCRDLDGKINLLADDKTKASHAYFHQNHFLECEDFYQEATDYMAEVLENLELRVPELDSSHDVSGFSNSSRSSHLPRINLPTFDGTIEKWESFRDRFQSMIINDTSLSNVDRMHYLCSSVKGDAGSALDHLAVTNSNFEVAWKILVSRYDNARRLITTHIKALLTLPAVPGETFNDLWCLRDQTKKALQVLKNLGRPVDQWDDLLVVLVAEKLDKATRKAWELLLGDTVDFPPYRELDHFLEARIRALKVFAPSHIKEKPNVSGKGKTLASHTTATVTFACPACKANHLLYQCPTFLKQTPAQRFEFLKEHKRCLNCFSSKHVVKDCTNSRVCRQCSKRHHTLVHFEKAAPPTIAEQPSTSASAPGGTTTEVASHVLAKSLAPRYNVLLATARVRVYSPSEVYITVRALVDQGSVATFITESLAQRLRLAKLKRSVCVAGIGEMQSAVRHAAQITITPVKRDGPAYSTTALILRSLTKYLPNRVHPTRTWRHISGLELADQNPMSREPIDVIIGSDIFGMILFEGVRRGSDSEPIAQNTTLGWILSGPVAPPQLEETAASLSHHGFVVDTLDRDLRRFWEIEELPQMTHRSPEEQQCEEHFFSTHSRTPQGRYIVRLPFKSGPPISLGDSRSIAFLSLRRLEQRLQRDANTAPEYRDFLAEYENLGHMEKIPPNEKAIPQQSYYIPHHAVLRNNSTTTRLRVVFNASCRTTNGLLLNDQMLVGPKLQRDLVTVILRWRQCHYVLTADIAKMFWKILVDLQDIDYQRILWRPSPTEMVTDYRLLTVTYGTAAAPYLAIRVLDQLAEDEGMNFPLAIPVLRHQVYVDDCTFGADDKILARQTRDQLIELLDKGGFRLRKWASNHPDLLTDLDSAD